MKKVTTLLFLFVISINTLASNPRNLKLLDNQKLISESKEITTEVFPDSDDAIVDEHSLIRYNSDGTYEHWNERCLKVLTERGKRQNRTVSSFYNLFYSTATVESVEIIKPDGTIIPIDIAKQSRQMIDRSQMGVNIYDPNDKIIKVSVPGLEIGDMCKIVFWDKILKTRMSNTWSDYSIFETTSPILSKKLEVFGPTNFPLNNTIIKGKIPGKEVKYSVEEKAGTNRYFWTVKKVPRMFPEPDMPALGICVQRVLSSTIPDWETVSQWYYNLSEPRFQNVTEDMTNKVAELTKGLTTRDEKIKAIFQYVSQKIRYMGITTEKCSPGYEPHDVNITFENKYGVCRDKAALLVVMLRLSGFKAYPVLIHAGQKKDEEVPQPYFNHAITCVQNDDGSYTLMDSTDENTKQLLPGYLCNKSYLVAKPEGDILRTSPIVPAEENMMDIKTTGKLDASGNLTAASTIVFDGINDNAYRGYFSSLKLEERKEFFEKVIKIVVAGAKIESIEVLPKDMQDISMPLTVNLNFTAKNILISGDKNVILPPVWIGKTIGMVNFIIGQTGLEKRKYTLETGNACGVKESFQIDIGEAVGEKIALPNYKQIDSPNITWEVSVSQTGNFLIGEGDFRIKTVEFSTNEYLEFKSVLKDIEYDNRKRAVFQKSSEVDPMIVKYPNADIVVLDSSTIYELQAGETYKITSSVKKKILTYAGKKQNSEIKLNYNPVWETVEITNVLVTTKDGEKKTLVPEEINLMDAGWVGSAPRYSAAKTLVASLPGVDVGSIIEYTIIYKMKDRPFFSMANYFRDFNPIEKKSVKLISPKNLKLKIIDIPKGKVVMKSFKKVGKKSYEWAIKKPEAAVKFEDSLPPWWYFNPGVLVSSGDWKSYAKKVNTALVSATANQKKTVKKAKELTKNSKNISEKIIAIRDFVAKNIRSAGPGLSSLPLSEISKADVTLKDGYGNSSDRAVLIYAMLKAVSFKPDFVLASYEPEIEGLKNPELECPMRGVFSSPLVRITNPKIQKFKNPSFIYLNDSSQYSELGTTYYDNRKGLVTSSGEIELIKSTKGKEDKSEIIYDVKISEEGSAVIKKTRKIYGTSFSGFHRRYAEITPENRRRLFLEMVSEISRAAKADSKLVTKYDCYPAIEEFSVTIEKFAVRDDKYLYFSLPGGGLGLPGIRADKRENPVFWNSENEYSYTAKITLPENFKTVELAPKNFDWLAPEKAGDVIIKTEQNKNILTVIKKENLKPAIISEKEYKELLEINRKLSHPDKRTVLVKEEQND